MANKKSVDKHGTKRRINVEIPDCDTFTDPPFTKPDKPWTKSEVVK